MERLWSPWRYTYAAGVSSAEVPCIFCEAADRESHDLVLVRSRLCYAILNLYPYNSGHLMVAPKRHVANLASMTPDEQSALMRLTRHAEMALTEVYRPQGL